MVSQVASEFIVKTTLNTLTATGAMGILRLSDPRASAAAVLAGYVAVGIFYLIAKEAFNFNDYFFYAGVCGCHYFFGSRAGRWVDPQFAYMHTALSLVVVTAVFWGAARILGI